jgi:YidC/Oxa1 family membrane protein insertase
MEKRVFLAIFLSFGVLALYQAYFAPPVPAPQQAAQVATPPPATPPASTAPAASAGASAPTAAAPTAPAAAAIVSDAAARDIAVETSTVSAVFSSQGAVLKSWKLKQYLNAGHPLELIPQNLPDQFPKPLSVAVDDPAVSAKLRAALFKPSADSLSLGAAGGTLEFEYQEAGLVARKKFQFQPDGRAYLVIVDASVDVGGKPQPVTVEWGPGLGLGYDVEGAQAFPIRAIQLRDKVERLAVSDVETQGRYEAPLRFAGVEDQYFLTAVLPQFQRPAPQTVRVDYQPVSHPLLNDPQNRIRKLIAYSARTPGPASLAFFMGPKELDVLRAIDPQLTGAIDFGIFRFLVVPLLQALKWVNGFLGNWGWSIVVLTILINLLIFPLRHRSMVSMRKMQSIQPEVKAIQERYAKYKITDPERQKMNQEMMALYKQRGVNPASGCVPMLLTMPVLFAFYAMLSAAIEVRGAHFFGWITDLSLMDPYYVTPILMGGTMFWQQKMMPTTADPVQQKMFLLMPIIFTAMFLWAPSGLVVYWFVSNLLAIGQQYLTNRMIGPPPRPAAPPPRPAKAIGQGGKSKS